MYGQAKWQAAVMGIVCAMVGSLADAAPPIVIAHRGASGYLPEHTLAGKALAFGMGADYIEQDVVLTRDDQPIVLHDLYLEAVTNVADLFPDRRRDDGHWYAIDLTLEEIKRLRVHERIDPRTGRPVFPGRFPVGRGAFRIATLAEEIELIQGLNRTTGRQVGIYPEIKSPAWHRRHGKDLSRVVLQVLHDYGYRRRDDPVFVQCFDADELRRIRHQLRSPLKLVQLIGENQWGESTTDYDAMRTPEGIAAVAEYADGIGPWLPHVIRGRDEQGRWIVTDLVQLAHQHGLVVHPYTLRADKLPDFAPDFQQLVRALFRDARVDGVFTDFPDKTIAIRDELRAR